MNLLTTDDTISIIIERAGANEMLAAFSKNLKGSFVNFIRKGAYVECAAATELAKGVGPGEVELRAKLHDLEQKLTRSIQHYWHFFNRKRTRTPHFILQKHQACAPAQELKTRITTKSQRDAPRVRDCRIPR